VVTRIPLTTLLSWGWIAFTIEADNAFEAAGSERVGRLFRISLPMWANGLRCIGADGISVRELRAQARAACNIGGLERWGWITVGFLERRGLAQSGPQRSVTLTGAGRRALDDYRARATAGEDQALREALEAVVSRREALAEGLVPPPGCWRGEKPYLTQTQRVLADPAAALPWHPTVLHRGGWPDGS
jgi:hypothetical protein